MADIQRASLLLQQRTTLQQEIRDQVEVFKTRARYRASSDTLPTPESLSVAENGRGSRVLLEDSWRSTGCCCAEGSSAALASDPGERRRPSVARVRGGRGRM